MRTKVISFNIRLRDDPDGNSRQERAVRLNKILSTYDADLIGFQEFVPGWEKHIKKYFSKNYDIFNKYRSEKIDVESSPILWKKDKYEHLSDGYFWLSDTPEAYSRGWDERFNCYRMCVYVILREKATGKEFTFMNTHFGFGDNGQIKSARLIADYTKKISDNPTFIIGDFNMGPQKPGYSEMTQYFTDVNSVTAKDYRNTFHGYKPENKYGNPIDYCFVDDKIKPLSLRIIDESVDGKYPSDHFGLYVELDI